jgi:putative sigma-54 modulation protein
MQIQIQSTKLEMTDAIRDYIQEKVDMLEKFLVNFPIINCHFEIEKASHSHSGEIFRAEMNLNLGGDLLRVEKTEEDMYKAIDKVKDHMEQAIIKYKEKKREN